MRLLLFLFIFTSSPVALSTPLVFHDFVTQNFDFAEEDHSVDGILEKTHALHPDLKIIILDQFAPFFSQDFLIQFNDPTVSLEAFNFYSTYAKTMIQNVGFYLAPGAEMRSFLERPLKTFPLLVMRKNTPMHAALHELGHFFLDLKERQGHLATAENEDLQSLIDGIANESFVDFLLLSNSQLFNFGKDEVCARQKYLKQNNRVFSFLLSELSEQKEGFSKKDLEIYTELKTIYSQAYSAQMKWHTDCFFWKSPY